MLCKGKLTSVDLLKAHHKCFEKLQEKNSRDGKFFWVFSLFSVLLECSELRKMRETIQECIGIWIDIWEA